MSDSIYKMTHIRESDLKISFVSHARSFACCFDFKLQPLLKLCPGRLSPGCSREFRLLGRVTLTQKWDAIGTRNEPSFNGSISQNYVKNHNRVSLPTWRVACVNLKSDLLPCVICFCLFILSKVLFYNKISRLASNPSTKARRASLSPTKKALVGYFWGICHLPCDFLDNDQLFLSLIIMSSIQFSSWPGVQGGRKSEARGTII